MSRQRLLVLKRQICVSPALRFKLLSSLIYNLTPGTGRDNVEGPYYEYSGRNMYDIRRSSDDNLVSDFFVRYLNLPSTQEACGGWAWVSISDVERESLFRIPAVRRLCDCGSPGGYRVLARQRHPCDVCSTTLLASQSLLTRPQINLRGCRLHWELVCPDYLTDTCPWAHSSRKI